MKQIRKSKKLNINQGTNWTFLLRGVFQSTLIYCSLITLIVAITRPLSFQVAIAIIIVAIYVIITSIRNIIKL